MSTFTQDHLRQLDEAIATGELTIERDGRRVTYRSMDELMRARAFVAQKLLEAIQPVAAGRPGTTLAEFHRD